MGKCLRNIVEWERQVQIVMCNACVKENMEKYIQERTGSIQTGIYLSIVTIEIPSHLHFCN